jgi:hypothetical protein
MCLQSSGSQVSTCLFCLNHINSVLDFAFKIFVQPLKKNMRKRKIKLCREKLSRESLQKEGRWPLAGMPELIRYVCLIGSTLPSLCL